MFFNDYLHSLKNHYKLAEIPLSETLVSPHVLTLPQSVYDKVKAFVEVSFLLRNQASYQKEVALEAPSNAQFDPGNYSALMSYDFHVDAQGHPRLIEINTNAAASLILYELYLWQKLQPLVAFDDEIIKTFQSEYALACKGAADLKHVAIVDAVPAEQKLFGEFLLFQSLFRMHGIEASIVDTSAAEVDKFNFIYNRDTDFYFESARTQGLQKAYLSKAVCVSPNPHEYALLADKARLLKFSDGAWLQTHGLTQEQAEVMVAGSIATSKVNSFEPDKLWEQRKNLFFKPQRSFGSKAVYRGKSISRSMFDNILKGDFLAQEFVPPAEIQLIENGATKTYKYDLRFYVYKDQIQLVGARLFTGQVTSMNEIGGGFAPVVFV